LIEVVVVVELEIEELKDLLPAKINNEGTLRHFSAMFFLIYFLAGFFFLQ